MNINWTVIVVVLILSVVMIVALFRFDNVILMLKMLKNLGFIVHGRKRRARNSPVPTQERIPEPEHKLPWFFCHWRTLLIGSASLLICVAPVWWWFAQPEAWRTPITDKLTQIVLRVIHGVREPVRTKDGYATLEELAQTIERRAVKLNDSYREDEIWIVNHYWQYWPGADLQQYLTLNKLFVAKGGKIHRMFILSKEELQNPAVQAMLQEQCQIGHPGGGQTGNGFELWRGDPEILKEQEEYQTVARQFGRLHQSDESFENFDVVQFKDIFYYSSDFLPGYRGLGSSTWIFDPVQVSKIDLRPLFQRHIAEKISCDGRPEQAAQQMVSAAIPQRLSNPL